MGVRLTSNSVEQFTIKVPRTRLSYFQDDIYPSTICVEESAVRAGQWLQGENGQQKILNLKPPNMKSCMLCELITGMSASIIQTTLTTNPIAFAKTDSQWAVEQ